MINDKVKAMLHLSGKKHGDMAEYLGISKQAFSNKLRLCAFTFDDLIKIATFCGCKVSIEFEDGHSIALDSSDLRK